MPTSSQVRQTRKTPSKYSLILLLYMIYKHILSFFNVHQTNSKNRLGLSLPAEFIFLKNKILTLYLTVIVLITLNYFECMTLFILNAFLYLYLFLVFSELSI